MQQKALERVLRPFKVLTPVRAKIFDLLEPCVVPYGGNQYYIFIPKHLGGYVWPAVRCPILCMTLWASV